MNTKRIVIIGGTGFIGLNLAAFLEKHGLHPVLIARHKPERGVAFDFSQWDGIHLGDWVSLLDGADAVVNLAGKSVNCIKSPDNCDVILRSRISATTAIGQAMSKVKQPPPVWIQMSTAHIYGDPPTQVCDETAAVGYGFAPAVGKAWEEAFIKSLPANVRGVILRTGFVLGHNGGALNHLVQVAKCGFGGPVGHGKQGISWIHIDDLCALILQAIVDVRFTGLYNACTPHPVSYAVFMRALRKSMRLLLGIPVPRWAVRIGALCMRTDAELVIYGRYVISSRLETIGFTFRYPAIAEALTAVIRMQRPG